MKVVAVRTERLMNDSSKLGIFEKQTDREAWSKEEYEDEIGW